MACDPRLQDVEFVGIKCHQIGSISWNDPPKLAAEPDELRGISGGEAQGRLERYTRKANTVSNRSAHVECAAGQRSIGADASAVPHRDFLAG